MRIMWINNSGAGWADYVDVQDGTSVAKFISERLTDFNAADYLIRVNRMPVTKDQVLQEGDRVTCTALKIEGAQALTRAV